MFNPAPAIFLPRLSWLHLGPMARPDSADIRLLSATVEPGMPFGYRNALSATSVPLTRRSTLESAWGASAIALLLALLPFSAVAAPRAFVGTTIMPVAGEPIEDGLLVIDDGKIVAVGSRASVRLPARVETIDVSWRIIIPGLVDTRSHIGEVFGGDASDPIQPETRVLDSINVRDAEFKRALASGVTTANLMSGSGHLISGQLKMPQRRS